MELDLQSFFWALCAQLYSLAETRQPLPPLPHLGSYTKALLVSQDKWNLFVTPWLFVIKTVMWPSHQSLKESNDIPTLTIEQFFKIVAEKSFLLQLIYVNSEHVLPVSSLFHKISVLTTKTQASWKVY